MSPLPLTVPQILTLIAATTLAFGGFVRIAAILAVGLATLQPSTIDPFGVGAWLAVVAVTTLGPGAYSIDGLLFGRREIRIDRQRLPPRRDTNR